MFVVVDEFSFVKSGLVLVDRKSQPSSTNPESGDDIGRSHPFPLSSARSDPNPFRTVFLLLHQELGPPEIPLHNGHIHSGSQKRPHSSSQRDSPTQIAIPIPTIQLLHTYLSTGCSNPVHGATPTPTIQNLH